MAGLREARPGPPRGGKHKDISPLIGAIGGMVGGTGGAALGGGDAAGSEADLEGGEGASYGNRSSAPTTPQPDYSKLLTKPNIWANILSRGGAGIGYNNAVAGLAGTQLQGGQALEQIAARGGEARTSAEQAGGIEKDRMITDAALKLASAHGVPITGDADLQAFKAAISQPATALAQSKIQGEQLSQNLTNTALTNPNAQPNANAGVNASLSAPFFKNQQTSRMMLSPMEAGFQQGSVDTKPSTGLGTFQGGTTSTESMGFDKATGRSIKSNTVTPNFSTPSFNFDSSNQPSSGVNLSELAKKLSGGGDTEQDTNGYDEAQDRTPVPQVTAKPPTAPSLNQQAYPSDSIVEQLARFIKSMTANKSTGSNVPLGY